MSAAGRELRAFRAAIAYFTRIPVPGTVAAEDLPGTPRYFPLVGWLVGGSGALVWWSAQQILPRDLAVLISLAATTALTGALHEDGFADLCDGFGGGHSKERVLEIMKDPRIGAFGAIGVVLLLGIKVVAILHVPADRLPATLIAAHAASRWMAGTLLATHDYVRTDGSTKSRAVVGRVSWGQLLVPTVLGVAPLLCLLPPRYGWTLIPLALARWILGRWFTRRIGGYTGDCIGATQQFCEAVFYMTVVAVT